MNSRIKAALAPLTLLASMASQADNALFEGRVDLRTSIAQPARPTVVLNTSIFASAAGTLLQSVPKGKTEGKTVLILASQPGYRFQLDEKKGLYQRRAVRGRTKPQVPALRVQRKGNARVGRFSCSKVILTSDNGVEIEACLSPKLEVVSRLLGQNAPEQDAVMQALRREKIAGWPVKLIVRTREATSVWEVTKIEKKPPPPRLFDLTRYREAPVEDD